MDLTAVKTAVWQIKQMLTEAVQEGKITAEEAEIIFPIVLTQVLKNQSVGSS